MFYLLVWQKSCVNFVVQISYCQLNKDIFWKLTEISGYVLIDFSHTVKAATLIFISGRSLAISSAKQGKSGSIYNLVKNL